MRARNIKPGFFENPDLAELGPYAQVLFIGLWCLADREGRLKDDIRWIKAKVFPYYDTVSSSIDELLMQLYIKKFIIRYQSDSSNFIQIVNFHKHQAPHMRESCSIIPRYYSDNTKALPRNSLGNGEASPRSSDILNPDILNPDLGHILHHFANDGGGGGRIRKPLRGRKASLDEWLKALGNGLRSWFEEDWWPIQIRKVGKKECVMSVYDLNPDVELRKRIISAYKIQLDNDFQNRELDKVPHPTTWVNGSRWEDEGKNPIQSEQSPRYYRPPKHIQEMLDNEDS